MIYIKDFVDAVGIFVNSGLFADELMHGFINILFAGIFYYKCRNIKMSALVLFVTYIIDIDHLVDYFLFYGVNFSFSTFISLDYFGITQRAVVPFHAWEWVVLLVMYSTQTKKYKLLLRAIATGMFAHLIWDSITVGTPIFYIILYRISQSFIVI